MSYFNGIREIDTNLDRVKGREAGSARECACAGERENEMIFNRIHLDRVKGRYH